MDNYLNQIKNATTTLLQSDDYALIVPAIHTLHDVFSALSGVRATDITDADIYVPSGKAVSPIKAAHCLLEFERTRRFLRGIKKGIDHLLEQKPGSKINILYAGCGPYATLLTPFTAIYTSDQVCFSLLDINPTSLHAAQALYEGLGLLPYVKAFLLEDAATFRVDSQDDFDMMISETMLNGLQKEPIVSIKVNLAAQLKAGGIFIPKQVKIDAALLHPGQEMDSYMVGGKPAERIMLGTLYKTGIHIGLPQPVRISLPEITTHKQLALLTEIEVYDNEWLRNYNSDLTQPLRVKWLEPGNQYQAVEFEYVFGNKPHFAHKLIPQ